MKLQWAGGGRAGPAGRGNDPKEMGGRSARALTHGQNPLVINMTIREL